MKKVRIIEYNDAYDHIFGKGKGWIYATNYISVLKAEMLIKLWNRDNYKIDYNADEYL